MPVNLMFQAPFGMLIVGPSGSGKTTWFAQLMKHRKKLISPEPDWILLFYEEHQPIYDQLYREGHISQLIHGIPEDYNEIRNMLVDLKAKGKTHILACFDDGRQTLSSLENLYCIGSKHLRTSVITMNQSLFSKSPSLRVISNNSTYQVLMGNVRSVSNVATLANQLGAFGKSFIVEAFERVTKSPHGYIILNMHPKASEIQRCTSLIFPEESLCPVAFVKNSF